jgi:hypothetical protein
MRPRPYFVIELGDFSDNPSDSALPQDKKSAAALAFLKNAESKFALFNGPRYHVFGNHDTDQLSKEQVLSVLSNTGIAAGKSWYSFDQAGVHCVVIDASFKTDGTSYAVSNYSWDNTKVPAEEIEWLKADLAATKLPTIVFTHQMLNSQEQIEAGSIRIMSSKTRAISARISKSPASWSPFFRVIIMTAVSRRSTAFPMWSCRRTPRTATMRRTITSTRPSTCSPTERT